MTSETNDSDAKDPSDSSEGPGTAPSAAEAAPTARRSGMPTAGQDEQSTQAAPTVYATSGVYGAHAARRSAEAGAGSSSLVTSGVLALAAVAALLVVVVFKPGSGGTPAYGMIPTGSSAQQDGEQVAAAFLAAW